MCGTEVWSAQRKWQRKSLVCYLSVWCYDGVRTTLLLRTHCSWMRNGLPDAHAMSFERAWSAALFALVIFFWIVRVQHVCNSINHHHHFVASEQRSFKHPGSVPSCPSAVSAHHCHTQFGCPPHAIYPEVVTSVIYSLIIRTSLWTLLYPNELWWSLKHSTYFRTLITVAPWRAANRCRKFGSGPFVYSKRGKA